MHVTLHALQSFFFLSVTGGVCRHLPGCAETRGSHQRGGPVHCVLGPQVFLRCLWKVVCWGPILCSSIFHNCELEILPVEIHWRRGQNNICKDPGEQCLSIHDMDSTDYTPKCKKWLFWLWGAVPQTLHMQVCSPTDSKWSRLWWDTAVCICHLNHSEGLQRGKTQHCAIFWVILMLSVLQNFSVTNSEAVKFSKYETVGL